MRYVAVPVMAMAVINCTKRNPDYCESSTECNNGFECRDHGCVAIPDSSTSCVDKPCPSSTPVCQVDGSCALCTDDTQCESGLCYDDGSCELENAVIHVAPSGAASGNCGVAEPCSLAYGRGQVTDERHTIVLDGGDYTLSETFAVDATLPLLVVAGPSVASIAAPAADPAFEVSDGSELQILGASFRSGVHCADATLGVSDATFADPVGGSPWIEGDRCSVTVRDTRLLDSPAGAIRSAGSSSVGSLVVERVEVSRSAGPGIEADHEAAISESAIVHGDDVGIQCSGTCTLSRLYVYANHLGGARVTGAPDVTNNIIVRNGNDPDSDFGGLFVTVGSSSTSRIEHNTIAHNDSDTNASPRYAGGMYCTAAGDTAFAVDNLVCNNYAGNTEMSWSQIGGNCDVSGSMVQNVCTAGTFVASSQVDDPDYHLMTGATAIGGASGGTVTDDYDGDPRDVDPDFGADEYYP